MEAHYARNCFQSPRPRVILLGSMDPGNHLVPIKAMESLIVSMYFLLRGSLAGVQQKKSAEYQLEVNLGRIKYCGGTKQEKRRVEISLSAFQEGGFWRRLLLWLKNLFAPLLALFQSENEEKLQDTAEEAFLKM